MTTLAHSNHLKYAFVCSSNQNRSMAAHHIMLHDPDFQPEQLQSYGTGSQVKLPGQSATTPNVYDFGVKYSDMFADLKKQNEK